MSSKRYLREKIFEKNTYDESFSKEETELIDRIIKTSIEKRDLVAEKELNKILLK